MVGNPLLIEIIRREITDRGPIPFARFMELALYHPDHGYYTSARERIGKAGDFFTSPAVGSVFGRFLGLKLVQMWERLEKPQRFVLLELGAHRGWLAHDIMDWARAANPAFANSVDYRVCERTSQSSVLSPQSFRQYSDWREIESGSVVGCIFSNELVDALPFHRIQRTTATEWQELFVDSGATALQWVAGPLSFATESLPLTLREAAFPPGYTSEVHLAALDWVNEMARILKRGFLLTVDYGYSEAEYYAPHRSHGTLRCYHRHQASNDLLERVGEQDITAHVNFGALITRGTECGLDCCELVAQERFLVDIGKAEIERIISANPGKPDPLRHQLQTLLHPGGMGRAFKVLIQQKG